MPNLEQFNPYDEKYKKIEDLPEDQQQNFSNVEGGGFAKKEAEEKYHEAENIAAFVNSMRSKRLKVIEELAKDDMHWDVDKPEREKILTNIQRAIDTKLTAADILHIEGIECDVKKTITRKEEFLRGNFYNLDRASDSLRADKDVVMSVISRNASTGRSVFSLRSASEGLRNDKAVVTAAVEMASDNFKYASEDLRGDKELVIVALRSRGFGSEDILKYTSEEMRDDDEVAAVVLHNGDRTKENFEFLSERLRGNKNIVLAALAHSCNGGLICFASENLRGDWDVAMKSAIGGNIKLENISEEIRNDKNFLLEMMSKLDKYERKDFYESLPPEIKNSKEMILSLICLGSAYTVYIPDEAMKDREIALEYLKHSSAVSAGVPEEFQDDENFILEAMKHRRGAFYCAGSKLISDKNFILKVIQMTDGEAMQIASDELKNDFDFVLCAFDTNSKSIEYASKEILDKLEKFMPKTEFSKSYPRHRPYFSGFEEAYSLKTK